MYFSKNFKIILLILYFIICFLTNLLYKNPLFTKSLTIAKDFQEKFNSTFSKKFFLIITQFGSQVFYIPVFIIFFILNPLNYFIYILTTLILAIYIDCLMKIIYNNPRPFFVKPELFLQECELGFGNPSGHSFGSAVTYLGIWHLSMNCQKFKNNKKVKYGSLIFTFIFIILILMSRLYRGVHSLDQIIYGALLGLGFYYLMFYISDIYQYKPKKFFDIIDQFKFIFISLFIFLIILVLPFYFIFKKNDKKIDEYNKNVNDKCKSKEDFLRYYNNGLVGCLLVLILLGMYLGLIYVKKKCDEEFFDYENKILNLNKSNLKINLIRTAIFFIFGFPILLALVIKSQNLFVIFIFKIGLSFFLSSFSMFGFGTYFGYIISNKFNNNESEKGNSLEYTDKEISEYSTVNASPPEKFSIVEIHY